MCTVWHIGHGEVHELDTQVAEDPCRDLADAVRSLKHLAVRLTAVSCTTEPSFAVVLRWDS